MIIIHEALDSEANHIAKIVEEVLSVDCALQSEDLSHLFERLERFNAFWHSCDRISEHLYSQTRGKKIIVLTSRDIYFNDESREDNWCFAYEQDNPPKTSIVISTSRLKGRDSSPGKELEIPENLYLQRLAAIALHEIGHDVVKGGHLQDATWVNAQTVYTVSTGPHCPNNDCVLYQVADVQTPHPREGHFLVGGQKRFDAGLDDLITRLNQAWFCGECIRSLEVDQKYR